MRAVKGTRGIHFVGKIFERPPEENVRKNIPHTSLNNFNKRNRKLYLKVLFFSSKHRLEVISLLERISKNKIIDWSHWLVLPQNSSNLQQHLQLYSKVFSWFVYGCADVWNDPFLRGSNFSNLGGVQSGKGRFLTFLLSVSKHVFSDSWKII